MSRVLAIGDIHTKIWIINAIKEIVEEYDKIVFVGDYADDWHMNAQKSIDTWQALKDFQEANPSKVVFVTGNHDYIYVNDTKTTQSGYNQLTQTLIDMPENKELRGWLRNLPVTLELDGVTYSHAGITDTFKQKYTSEWLWQDNSPLWARPLHGNSYLEISQVFGHTPSETCWEVQKNIWCIDTFSTYPDGTPIGDHTVLEVENGNKFTKRKIKNGNDNTSSIERSIS